MRKTRHKKLSVWPRAPEPIRGEPNPSAPTLVKSSQISHEGTQDVLSIPRLSVFRVYSGSFGNSIAHKMKQLGLVHHRHTEGYFTSQSSVKVFPMRELTEQTESSLSLMIS